MYKIGQMPGSIELGYIGENLFRPVEIDMTAWMQKCPAGVPSIIHIRPGETEDDAYIANTTFDSETNVLTWLVTDADLGTREGEGTVQVWIEEATDDVDVTKRGKTLNIISIVKKSATEPAAETPAPQTGWMEQMTELKTATVNAAEEAQDAKDDAVAAKEDAEDAKTAAEAAQAQAEAQVQHYPVIVDGYWAFWNQETEQYVKSNQKAQGEQGEPGEAPIDDTAPAADKVYSSSKVEAELTPVKNAIQELDNKFKINKSNIFNAVQGEYDFRSVENKDRFAVEIHDNLKNSLLLYGSNEQPSILESGIASQVSDKGITLKPNGDIAVEMTGTATANVTFFFFGNSSSNAGNVSVVAGDVVSFFSDYENYKSTTVYYVMYCKNAGTKIFSDGKQFVFSSDDVIYGVRIQFMSGVNVTKAGGNPYTVWFKVFRLPQMQEIQAINTETGLSVVEMVMPGRYIADVSKFDTVILQRKSWSNAGTYSLIVDEIDGDLLKAPIPSATITPMKTVYECEKIQTGTIKVFGSIDGKLFGAEVSASKCYFMISDANYENFTTVAQIGTETELPINIERIKGGFLCLGKTGIVWKSTNNGSTWTNVLELRQSASADQIHTHVYLPGAFPQIATDMKGNVIVSEYRRPERHNTAYSGADADGGKLHLSTDNGDTWTTVFDIAVNIGAVKSTHIHSCAIDPYDGTLWIVLGDWPNQKVYWSIDNGATWTGGADAPISSNQYTAVFPLSGCIGFGTDAHCCGVGYVPKAGAKTAVNYGGWGDMSAIIHTYPINEETVQPVCCRVGTDQSTNVSMFGYFVSAGNDGAFSEFLNASVYVTDGILTRKVFENESTIIGGVTSVFYDDVHGWFVARLGTEYLNNEWQGEIVVIR